MSESHDTLLSAVETYKAENEKFTDKGVKSAGTRARKCAQELKKLLHQLRKDIQEKKNKMGKKKK